MSNIDIYKEYIQDSIINRLERLMGNDGVDDVNLWEKYGSKGLTPQKDSVYRSMLHAMMVPGDTRDWHLYHITHPNRSNVVGILFHQMFPHFTKSLIKNLWKVL